MLRLLPIQTVPAADENFFVSVSIIAYRQRYVNDFTASDTAAGPPMRLSQSRIDGHPYPTESSTFSPDNLAIRSIYDKIKYGMVLHDRRQSEGAIWQIQIKIFRISLPRK